MSISGAMQAFEVLTDGRHLLELRLTQLAVRSLAVGAGPLLREGLARLVGANPPPITLDLSNVQLLGAGGGPLVAALPPAGRLVVYCVAPALLPALMPHRSEDRFEIVPDRAAARRWSLPEGAARLLYFASRGDVVVSLDRHHGPVFEEALKRIGALARYGDAVLLDLAGIDALDSGGVGYLHEFTARLRQSGVRVIVAGLPDRFQAVTRFLHQTRELELYKTVAEAVNTCPDQRIIEDRDLFAGFGRAAS